MFKLCPFFPLPLYLVATGLRTIQFLLFTQPILRYNRNKQAVPDRLDHPVVGGVVDGGEGVRALLILMLGTISDRITSSGTTR
jgi:hypothetical protein